MTEPPDAASTRWRVLAIVAAIQCVYIVDVFIVSLAAGVIQADLAGSAGQTQALLAFYLLAFASLVITGGRLGDLYGARRLLLIGLALFAVAGLGCASARTMPELIIARMLQAVGSALMVPQVMATIHVLFPAAERGRAIGVFGLALGIGGVLAYGGGGLLLQANLGGLGWRLLFICTAGAALVLGMIAALGLPVVQRRETTRLDIAGALLLFIALGLSIGPVLLARDRWPMGLVAGLGAAGLGLLALFWRYEQSLAARGGAPLIAPALFAVPRFRQRLGAIACFMMANQSFYFLIALHTQRALGLSPLATGFAMLPGTIAFAWTSTLSGARFQRLGTRALLQGLAIQIGALIAMAGYLATVSTPQLAMFVGLLTAIGAGQGLVMAPLFGSVLTTVPPADAGAGSGVSNTVQQAGNAVGVTIAGAIYFGTLNATGAGQALALTTLWFIACNLVALWGIRRSA